MKIGEDVKKLIELALREDFGEAGDVTSLALFDGETVTATLLCKDTGVLAGAAVFTAALQALDKRTRVVFMKADGDGISPGDRVARIEGRARSVLGGERTALNFICFLSGIATRARQYAEEAARFGKTTILDTRKTLPGFRSLSKYAVRVGGAANHRLGLYDRVLIKDNHSDAIGSLARAVDKVREKWGRTYAIEAECRNLDEVRQALEKAVDFIMLDNMKIGQLKESLALIHGRIPVEISGTVRLPDLKTLVPLGADFISIGALTHSVENFDFSLEFDALH